MTVLRLNHPDARNALNPELISELGLGLVAAEHPGAEEPSDQRLEPAWRSRADLARRALGASFVLSRMATVRGWPVPQPPRWMQRAFPGSLYSVGGGDWGAARYPDEWPDQRLWLVAADLDQGGRRVVLHRDRAPLGTAVMASCAVPGVLPPVRVGRRRLIDGGLRSSTNLDLAGRVEPGLVVVLAPLGFEADPATSPMQALGRRRFNTRLDREVATVRGKGSEVLVIRPDGDEIAGHSSNVLTRRNSQAVTAAAYEATARRLSAAQLAPVA